MATWLVVMMLGVGGGVETDFLSLVETEDYFKARNIVANVENMNELAAKDPIDAKTQAVQLLALRWLAEHAAKTKTAPGYPQQRKMYELIAQGKKAQDKLGFARDYARELLTALDNQSRKAGPASALELREQMLAWFPANGTLAFAMDVRGGSESPWKNLAAFRKMMLKEMGPQEREEMYKGLETTGNIRVEKVAFAHAEGQSTFFIRAHGKMNQAWVVKAMKKNANLEMTQMEGSKGETITRFQEKFGQEMVLIGDTDFVLAGHEKRRLGEKEKPPVSLITQVLDVQGGKKESVLSSSLKTQLAKIPQKASGFLVGHVPEEVRHDLERGAKFSAAPREIDAWLTRTLNGVDVEINLGMEKDDQAIAFAAKILDLKNQGLTGLKNTKVPHGLSVEPIQKVLESLQVDAVGTKVQCKISVSREATNLVPYILLRSEGPAPKVDSREPEKD